MNGYIDDAEEMILAMADIVYENRRLRQLVDNLTLDKEINDAYRDALFGNKEKEERYQKLSDARMNNTSVDMMDSLGWGHNQKRVDWREIAYADSK